MSNLVTNIILIVAGCALIAFREKFARYAIGYQNKMWKFHFGEDMVRIGTWIILLISLGFIWTGAQALLNRENATAPGGVQRHPSIFTGGIIVISIGIVLIISDEVFARYGSNLLAKVFRVKLNKADARKMGRYFLFMGVVAVVSGTLMLISATHTKW